MARTYSFDHFTVPEHGEPGRPGEEKAHISGKAGVRGDGRPRYGKRFAETEELSYVKQMNQQLEELAGMEKPKISRPREPERPEAPIHRGPVIGAVPAATEVPPSETLLAIWGEGQRYLRLLRHCVRDGVSAGYRLAALPWHATRLMARRMTGLWPARLRPA
ncbi:MAG TPA: hypothetical protein VND93_00935 [Myxococcales bacterium]|jgi:hypothetical protein|nr:hypothetical protein [Myxococcales bacterium]